MKRTLTFATMLVAFAVLTIVGVFHETRKVHAQDQLPPPVGDRISFGLVTLTTGQTARINVANVIAQGDANLPPGPSRVAILMVDSSGNPFRTRDGSPIRRVVMLGRGESTFLELNADDFAIGAGGRIQLRAVVTVHPPPEPDRIAFPPDPCVPTFEVINNANGRTAFALSGLPAVQRIFPAPTAE